VRSIVDRFLEHSRIFYFENACQPEIIVSTADWMPRNFFRRIEVGFPIEDGNLRERLTSEILALSLADNTKARFLRADGPIAALRVAVGEKARRSQFEFIELAKSDSKGPRKRSPSKSKYARVQLAARPLANGRMSSKSPSRIGDPNRK